MLTGWQGGPRVRRGGMANLTLCLQVANLLLAAGPTHRWYRRHFRDYPARRRAIIPYVY